MTAHAQSAPCVLRLLIVEDDLRSAVLLRDLLGTSSDPLFEVQHVTTAAAACDAVAQDPPDLIILDLGLPDARDLEALSQLERCMEDVPVIVLTGHPDETLALRALSRGAEDFLRKGYIDRDSLIRSIRYSIERHRGVRDLARVKKQLESANRDLERLTMLDPLTDVLNRRGLQQVLSDALQRLSKQERGTAVMVADLDDFKVVNEALGHAVGDVVLQEIARRIRVSVRAMDYIGRIGGDEFMIILPDADKAEIVRIAERVRLAIGTTIIQHGSGSVTVTASIATLLLSSDTPAIDQVLSHAALMLSRAKNSGKNRVLYRSSDFDDTGQRSRFQSDMCLNLVHGRHVLTVKQPIYRLEDESPIGYEFLTRYSNGRFELPENFFRVASERNVLTLVDHVCMRKAIGMAMLLPPFARFHLNVFPATLLAIPVEHLLETFPQPIPDDTFCLEISEQQIIGDPSYLIPVVKRLREAGIRIAVDDVGFGSSCLESLVVLSPDIIKIDKRCVIGIDGDPERVDHLRRYVGVARSLGCELIAEGIETAAELAVVQDLGIHFGQGYLWGKPA